VNWLRRLFKRDSAPPAPPPERTAGINPLPAETAVQWSAEDQALPDAGGREEWMEKGEPDPRRQDNP
jgi:hypothetical protein